MAFWFGLTTFDPIVSEAVEQEIHGPYENTNEMEAAIDDLKSELEDEEVIVVPIRFMCEDEDVPEVVYPVET